GAPLESFGYAELEGRPVSLREVRVPAGQVLGPLPAAALPGLIAALRRAEDRLATAAALGLLARCLEEARAAASAPREGGKPAASHQLVRFELAEMLTQLQTAELLALRAAAAAAAGSPEAERLGLCAKVFASEAACRVSDQALGILAGAGYLRSHPVARALAEARLGCLAGHSSHAARLALADDVLARLAPV
ncbi:MAG TPA: acyl-CoA dehydrogenase family protein, partial [Myxococcota bacterium]|nr:acyl-CoA dehydrogenase family protein [Myxococcota bacterium]